MASNFRLAVFLVALLGGMGFLALGVSPGVIEDAVFGFPLCLLSIPLVGCWAMLLIGLAQWDLYGQHNPLIKRKKWGVWSAVVSLATVGLLWLHVPERIAFGFCVKEFEALVESAPTLTPRCHEGGELNRRIGPFLVDRYGEDVQGGVYFRTHTEANGFLSAHSYGFAFRPNAEGSTPFGRAIECQPLFGDWYVFIASNYD